MKILLPEKVVLILNLIKNNGFEAYAVGGCIRDSLLRRKPKDWDIASNSTPEENIDIFNSAGLKTIATGIKHGTITVMIENAGFEVTTFRIDKDYLDGRRPENVEFTSSIVEDLGRRDFTINAMAYNEEFGLIDPYLGQGDLEKKVVKCVGDPEKRFCEDSLRMMRAVRFASELDFEIEDNTKKAILKKSELLNKISQERIRDEFNKILLSNPEKVKTLYELGILNQFLPEFVKCFYISQDNIYHVYNVEEHILKSVTYIEPDLLLRLTMLFHDIGKPLCKTVDGNGTGHFYGHDKISSDIAVERLKAMRYDNNCIENVRDLIKFHDQPLGNNEKSLRKWLGKIGPNMMLQLIKVKEADIKAQNPLFYNKRYEELQNIKKIINNILSKNECFEKEKLAIKGTDLIEAGFPEGKEIGIILNNLLEKVIESPELNKKEILIKLAMDMNN